MLTKNPLSLCLKNKEVVFILLFILFSFTSSYGTDFYEGDNIIFYNLGNSASLYQTHLLDNFTVTDSFGHISYSTHLSPTNYHAGYYLTLTTYSCSGGILSFHSQAVNIVVDHPDASAQYIPGYNFLLDQDFNLAVCHPGSRPSSCADSEKLCKCGGIDCDQGAMAYYYVGKGHTCGDDKLVWQSVFVNDQNCTNPVTSLVASNSVGDCFCPGDDQLDLPPGEISVTNFVHSLSPEIKPVGPDPDNNKFDCSQSCFPGGYIYVDGHCKCFKETTPPYPGTQIADTSPALTPENTSSPADPNNDNDVLNSINDNLSTQVNQANSTNEILSQITNNQSTVTQNQSTISNDINSLHSDLSQNLHQFSNDIVDAINNQSNSIDTSNIENTLSNINNKLDSGFNLEGDSPLPGDNIYSSEVDTLEEDSLSDAIGNYISSGIPILSYIRGTSLSLSNATSSMTVDLWGDSVTFDLAPMADILDTMGYILSGISLIVAFGIIVNRG